MGKVLINSGGSSVDLDVITATESQILKSFVSVDNEGEPITGTLELSGNATNEHVLAGETYYNTDPHTKNTGTMIDRRNIDPNLGGINSNYPAIAVYKGSNLQIGTTTSSKESLISMQPPAGYYDGGSYVGALATSFGDATAAYVYNGKYFTSSAGLKVKGTMTVSSVLSFSVAAYSTTQLLCTWKNPAQASGRPFSGVIICCKTGSYPTSPTDGFKYMGSGGNSTAQGTGSATISGLTAGTTYYLRIWSYCVCSAGNYTVNSTKVLTNGYLSATCKTTASGRMVFTSSTTWTVPAGITSINIFCVGGGGGSGSINNLIGGGGGGGGYTAYKNGVSVTYGNQITITVGAGGTYANNGGISSAAIGSTVLVSANGGNRGGTYGSAGYPGSGGSGGGGGYSSSSGKCYNGGSDGSNGEYHYTSSNGTKYGYGQGTTTREFGQSTGTLYAGGGGGGAVSGKSVGYGVGGAGGGGNGAAYNADATSGSAGTGGGAGGIRGYNAQGGGNSGAITEGGSGVVVITW